MRTVVAVAGVFLTLMNSAFASETQAAITDQSAEGNDQRRTSNLEEIIVTAQKREQNLQDIGISISAIGAQRIEEMGLQSLNDLMGQVPGVSFSSVGPGEGNLVIRGLATGELRGTVNNRKEAVGAYLNDTPIGQVRYSPDISPFDLERVEVLRGPQGTLYGSGSLAGTVRYITKKPSMQGFETKVGADLSSTKRGGINHRLDAMVNVPLSDTFALRAVGYEQFDDGYIKGAGLAYRAMMRMMPSCTAVALPSDGSPTIGSPRTRV